MEFLKFIFEYFFRNSYKNLILYLIAVFLFPIFSFIDINYIHTKVNDPCGGNISCSKSWIKIKNFKGDNIS